VNILGNLKVLPEQEALIKEETPNNIKILGVFYHIAQTPKSYLSVDSL